MFGRLLDWYIHFPGLLPYNGICYVHSLCVQLLRSPILAGESLWHRTRNRITQLLQTVPPIFGWVAITFGITHILV